jgi:hypothetical protein
MLDQDTDTDTDTSQSRHLIGEPVATPRHGHGVQPATPRALDREQLRSHVTSHEAPVAMPGLHSHVDATERATAVVPGS